MLDDAVAAFLESTTERAFDQPLLALLRATGYDQVAWVHGAQEFGKDVVAQRDGEQWAFQSKAGDINQTAWRGMVGQLDELRLSDLSGPHFRKDLPRRPVLVCTGRLSGNASLLAQEYQQRARDRNEPVLEIWNRDVLVGKLSGDPDSALHGSVDGQLLSLLGGIDQGQLHMDALELFSRRWMSWEATRMAGQGIIEASVACERLRAAQRLDLACHLALCGVRAAWAGAPDIPSGVLGADAAGALFEHHANTVWAECDDRLLSPRGLVAFSGYAAWITYPLRCVRVAEIISLLALRVADTNPDLADDIAGWLVRFIAAQPGVTRPISDRYAVSLVPVALLLARKHIDTAIDLLRRATIWLCDRYEHGQLGLADAASPPAEEIARVLGSPFESVTLARREASQLAGVLLDLAASLGLTELYGDIRNDTLAVGLHPTVLLPDSGPDQYSRTGFLNRLDYNPDYADDLDANSPAAPHLAESSSYRELAAAGRPWDLLAISAALRDRHFPVANTLFDWTPNPPQI